MRTSKRQMESKANQTELHFKLHPWHGVNIGTDAPEIITCFIEIVPTDTVKYEIDKTSGYLKIDRPQKYSNVIPALYGFIPQTYCGELVAGFSMKHTGRKSIVGDGDPLDICVLTDREISHGDCLVKAKPIGGFRMLDGQEADDKIIAVMKDDAVYGDYKNISDCPPKVLDRLKHYFLTYKDFPGNTRRCEITHLFGVEEAHGLIKLAVEDYQNLFPKSKQKI